MKTGFITFQFDKLKKINIASVNYPVDEISGKPRAGDGSLVLSFWLFIEATASATYPFSLQRWMEQLEQQFSGHPNEDIQTAGDGIDFWFKKDLVLMEFIYEDSMKVLLNKNQIMKVLQDYDNVLQNKYDDPKNPPPPMKVEYIADGYEAEKIFLEAPPKTIMPER